MIPELHERLGSLVEKATSPVLACLTHPKALREQFLAKLSKRDSYSTLVDHVDTVTAEIMSLHEKVAGKVIAPNSVRYVDSVPLQILIVEKDDAAQLAVGKMACVVFHVGTGNIGTRVLEDGETGFYTEVDSVVEMFETMAESLWEAGKVQKRTAPQRPKRTAR